jgi:hypothetical protein
MIEPVLVEGGITEEELTRLALAADPLAADRLAVRAEAVADPMTSRGVDLPTYYMPQVMAGPRPGWFRAVAVVLVLGFATITALGFCITYGQLSFA